ncbi:NADP-dependent oxidoreductase domain-containing protein [Aspergillus lucknowensis]|uniref:D-xylose reductase [NAD(P)H] n=1 Tax=Aspergillus lucknowensis TaxID=176173 RepID=A0ABR4LL66_9EURO
MPPYSPYPKRTRAFITPPTLALAHHHSIRYCLSRRYSIALVGTGYRGYRSHFLSLLGTPDLSVTAVCDTNRAALDSFTRKHPDVPTYDSLSLLLHRHKPKPDFAIVSVPHGAHMECITALAAAGVHILKEKPVAGSAEEYSRMSRLPVKMGITFQKRFEPQFVDLRRLVPLVGDVAAVDADLALNITNLEETWRARAGVGVTEDLGCHMLDLLVWLLGLPTSVMAQQVSSVRPSQKYGGDDVADILMNWEARNCIGHVRLSRVAHEAASSITLTGTNGTLILNGHEVTHYDAQGSAKLTVKHRPDEKQVIQSMVGEFGAWVTGRRQGFSTSLANVRNTVSLVDAVKMSLASRRLQRPLPLPALAGLLGMNRGGPFSKTSPSRVSTATLFTSSHARCTDRSFLLNTGAPIPAVGLGTRRTQEPGMVYEAVRSGLKIGYRHIDTAMSSDVEHEIGQAVKDSGVSRSQVWITTKLDNRWHTRVHEALDLSLAELGMDYVDLYLMHWPVSVNPGNPSAQLGDWDFVNTWQEMQKLPTTKVRNIGVSNFGVSHLTRLLSHPCCEIVPAVNQVELHPYWPSKKLLQFCSDHGIHCTAYSCLGSANSPLLEDQVVLDICQKIDKSPQQVLIMWGVQRGTSVIPKTVNATRIAENFDLDGWALGGDEMARLDGCTTRFKSCTDDWLPVRVFGDND